MRHLLLCVLALVLFTGVAQAQSGFCDVYGFDLQKAWKQTCRDTANPSLIEAHWMLYLTDTAVIEIWQTGKGECAVQQTCDGNLTDMEVQPEFQMYIVSYLSSQYVEAQSKWRDGIAVRLFGSCPRKSARSFYIDIMDGWGPTQIGYKKAHWCR